MTVRKLIDGDIATSGVQFLYDIEDIEQTVQTRLKLWLGEYFRNINDGTPWIERILGKGVSMQTRESSIKRRIVQTPGVKEVIRFNTAFDLPAREYSAKVAIITDTDALITINVDGNI